MTEKPGIPEALECLQSMGAAYEANQPVPTLEHNLVKALESNPLQFARHLHDLSEPDLRRIIKGFILFSRSYSALGFRGSVSPCPEFFREYARRFPDSEADICAWVIDERRNPYDPFGTLKHNHARSMREHLGLMGNSAAIAHKNQEREAEKQDLFRRTKIDMERARAEKNLPGAVARGDEKAIKALKAKISGKASHS